MIRFLVVFLLGAAAAVAATQYLAAHPEAVKELPRIPAAGAASADDARGADVGAMSRDLKTPLRARNSARLDQLVVRTKQAQAARRVEWLFVSESAVVGELGPPDEVIALPKGGENWEYEIPFTTAAGEKTSGTLLFQMQRGRVVSVSGADDIPE
jgi:hypothetical protein